MRKYFKTLGLLIVECFHRKYALKPNALKYKGNILLYFKWLGFLAKVFTEKRMLNTSMVESTLDVKKLWKKNCYVTNSTLDLKFVNCIEYTLNGIWRWCKLSHYNLIWGKCSLNKYTAEKMMLEEKLKSLHYL